MGWIDDNKGQGPWLFAPQSNKWGYVNNPRWTTTPVAPINYDAGGEPQVWSPEQTKHDDAGSDEHFPCGHWHKQITGPIPPILPSISYNIYVLLGGTAVNTIMGYYFSDSGISYIGKYEIASSQKLNGLIIYNNELITVKNFLANARLLRIGLVPTGFVLPLIAESSPFNSYDVPHSVKLVNDTINNLIYAVSKSYIIQLSGLNRNARGFAGSVVTGTDGNLYYSSYVYTNWAPEYLPITGAYYSYRWELIPDNLFDGTLAIYGVGTNMCAYSVEAWARCYNGDLFVSQRWSPYSRLRKIDSSFDIIGNKNNTDISNQIFINQDTGIVYADRGNTDSTIHKSDASDLVLDDTELLPYGRYSAMTVSRNKLIVVASSYTVGDKNYLYKLNLDTLNIESSIEIDLAVSAAIGIPIDILRLNDQYSVIGHVTGISIYDTDSMTLVDWFANGFLTTAYGTKTQCMASVYV